MAPRTSRTVRTPGPATDITADAAPAATTAPASERGPVPLQEKLADRDGFVAVVELVPWRGVLDDPGGKRARIMATALATDPRVDALSVTDNAGGHPMASPEVLGRELLTAGSEVIVHVACRDRNRNEIASLGWRLASAGFRNVLCLSGDYPVEGYAGLARPVFDIDSVALLTMYSDLAAGRWPGEGSKGGHGASEVPSRPQFYLGAVVNNHKLLEAEVMTQYFKLAMKARAGAGFTISQVGYDARKDDELLKWMRGAGIDLPVLANAYLLTRGAARAFHSGRIPGCTVTDELLAVVEREGASPDKGKAYFIELAAKQAAIAKGLGYRGIYIGGAMSHEDVTRILDTAASYAPDDWRAFAREVQYAIPREFHYFEKDRATGLSSETVSRTYLRSKKRAARPPHVLRSPVAYTVNRMVHSTVFEPGTPGFQLAGRLHERAEGLHLGKALHVIEQAVKAPLYDCRDCGDCSLPDIAYLCPESQCAKNQRNGPCGGTHLGECEVPGKQCIWVRAYDRLKPWGEADAMLDRPPALTDNALRRTSAWASAFTGRDHIGKRIAAEQAARDEAGDPKGDAAEGRAG
ncbi:MAG: methylenetetrahydrofolate reductase C-terminal domain-containing protein [Chloroflexi bacterium]|nr:methylenetetrahydrofolate reductase C-terminal domain-containing protein [Chloroflexota bacterium]